MFTGVANHVGHSTYSFGNGRAINHGVGDRIVTVVTVTLMDSGHDVYRAKLIVAGQAGRGCFGQETVVVSNIDMVEEVVAMTGGAAAAAGRYVDRLAVRRL